MPYFTSGTFSGTPELGLYSFTSLWRSVDTTFTLVLAVGFLPFSGEILNIAMVINNTNSSGVGRMWLSAIPGDPFNFDPNVMLQFTNPTQFRVGRNKFGVLEITERRQISPSFGDMMGFTPVCHILLALFLV
jgi:hypothetical protein